ncbi:MAG: hypothetical protein JWN17_237, partial [Frankiales bacterium]|nr:hypothetical protein [Frankiales bacterium]
MSETLAPTDVVTWETRPGGVLVVTL